MSAVRVVIVGSGLAGLATALSLPPDVDVTVVSKRAFGDGNSRHAQGGIAAPVLAGDGPEAHARDTLVAGAGLSEPEPVRVLTSGAVEAVAALEAWGVRFDRDGDGPAVGREGAHSAPRILHAGGDATGAAIIAALAEALRRRSATSPDRTRILEHRAVVELAVDEVGRVDGVVLVAPDGARETLAADAVVLATGGAGQAYAHTTNPEGATGDGLSLAAAAGVGLRDLEFVQFHPTALATPGSFLVSEAVRGEGAVLRDERGARFMPAAHPDAELAPRDVVAREIARVMAAQGGRPVLLDATAIGERLPRRFPTIDAATRAAGLDWTREPVPVTPAAHYVMGGVETDLDGRTDVPGLWAVGEVARTGVHGANRLASNSLLEAVVFGRRVATALAAARAASPAVGARPRGRWAAADAPARPSAPPAAVPLTRAALRGLMWDRVGLVRDAAGLTAALDVLDRAVPSHRPGADAIERAEDAHLLVVARRIAAAALARTASVGAHQRLDEPTREALSA